MKRLRTFISPVVARCPARISSDSDVKLSAVTVNNRELYWLDEMLNGGLAIPDDLWDSHEKSPSFLLLLAGPPGTGKTTFALELCYNLVNDQRGDNDQPPWSSLFVSSESTSQRIIENASSFGWNSSFFKKLEKKSYSDPDPSIDLRRCNVIGNEYPTDNTGLGGLAPEAQRLFDAIVKLLQLGSPISHAEDLISSVSNKVTQESLPPDVVVIDSLNVLWPPSYSSSTEPANLLDTFFRLKQSIGGGTTAKRPKLLVVILDCSYDEEPNNPWEFLADAVFRFDRQIGPENYYVQSFQVVKIKTQSHALGKNHVCKILAGAGDTLTTATETTSRELANEVSHSSSRPLFGSPYRESGGICLFPSIHWHLSRPIREDPVPGFSRDKKYPTGLPGLQKILHGGFPSMHSTALVGGRGAMKSLVAWNFMLTHAFGTIEPDEPPKKDETSKLYKKDESIELPKNVLLVSLRDDPEAAKDTLVQIIQQQDIGGMKDSASEAFDALLASDRLEIVYNWPGCVSPNEFFHRIYVALARKRNNEPLSSLKGKAKQSASRWLETVPVRDTAEIVVVNGLDHLDVKFPLCADEKLFVPALVSLFRGFKLCSVFISADDRYGAANDIRPLADLILDFAAPTAEDYTVANIPREMQGSRVTAVRVPTGIGGLWGILSRNRSGRMKFKEKTSASELESGSGSGI